jgi:hypothetical protein
MPVRIKEESVEVKYVRRTVHTTAAGREELTHEEGVSVSRRSTEELHSPLILEPFQKLELPNPEPLLLPTPAQRLLK